MTFRSIVPHGPSQAESPSAAAAALIANRAFSGFHDAGIDVPDTLAPIATLNISAAGNYVINAKLEAHNLSATDSVNGRCTLTAGGDFDTLPFDVDGAVEDDQEALALQVVHTFTSPGSVILRCTDNGAGRVSAEFTKITAVQVAQLSNLPI